MQISKENVRKIDAEFLIIPKLSDDMKNIQLRNEFHFSGVHGAMNRSGSRAK